MKRVISTIIFIIITGCHNPDNHSNNDISDQDSVETDNNQSKILNNDYIPIACRDSSGELINEKIKAGQIEDHSIINERGHTIKFTAFHPFHIDCPNISQGAHPVILHGHGFGSNRQVDKHSLIKWRGQGYLVISIAQEGFGDSEGQLHIMSPDIDGENLIKILDYIEEEFDFIAWKNDSTDTFISRPEIPNSTAGGNNIIVGSIGGSYGGGYQLLLDNIDPKQRLDAISPDITWFDLRYSLLPNGIPKSFWDVFLFMVGESEILKDIPPLLKNNNIKQVLNSIIQRVFPTLPMDNTYTIGGFDRRIEKLMLYGLLNNKVKDEDHQYLAYHSPAYWCKSNNNIENTILDTPKIDLRHPPEIRKGTNALISQGFRDDLFNFNEAWWNWQCLKKRAEPSQDIFLSTHQGGHVIAFDQIPAILHYLETKEFNPQNCGSINHFELRKAMFQEKLRKEPLPENFSIMKTHACFSLNKDDAVLIPFESIMAPRIPELPGDEYSRNYTEIEANTKKVFLSGINFFDLLDPTGKIRSGGIVRKISDSLSNRTIVIPPNLIISKNTIPRNIKLLTIEKESIIAGIPEITFTMTPSTNTSSCDVCNVIINIGLGIKRKGGLLNVIKRIDRQTLPFRGTNIQHTVNLAGVAERLHEGDELYLMIFPQVLKMLNPFDIQPNNVRKIDFQSRVKLPIYDVENPVIITDFKDN